MSEPPTPGGAFARGGLGCLLAFLVIAILVLALGGRVRANAGGLIVLFIIGGVIGVIALAIYNRGRRDGGGSDEKRG